MSTKYENYITGSEGGQHVIGGTSWQGQTFTPSINHILASVKMKVHRTGSPGTLTVGIRATTSGLPSGADKSSGTYSGDGVTTNVAGEWIEITFSTGTLAVASIKYAIVCRCPNAAGGNYLTWHADTTGPTYTGGSLVQGISGSGWSEATESDEMFEEWGDPQGAGSGGSIYPSDGQTRVTSLTHRYNRGTYTLEMNLGEVVSDFGLPTPEPKPRQAVEPTPEEKQAFQEDEARRLRISPPVPEPEIAEPTAPKPSYPYTPPEVMQPLYEAEAARRQAQAAELGIGGAPTARTIRIQVEEADKIAILQEIERLNRSARATGITPYARDVLQRAIVRKQEELRKLYNA